MTVFFLFDQKLKMIGTIYLSFLMIFSSMQVCTGKQLQQLQRTVEKLQDTILSISKENAKYKILVEDMAKKVIEQERRIGKFERKCQISNDVLSEEYTNKSKRAENNLENDQDDKRLDSKKSTLPGQVLELAQSRRAIDSGKGHFLLKKTKKLNAIANFSMI